MEREEVESAIRSAFAGVRLGTGTSLQQARLIDDGLTLVMSQAEFASIPRHETTDDWTQIAQAELLCDALGHLDADGLRYYLPALMLWLLDHYNDEGLIFDPDASMTVIGTMAALAPSAEFARYRWDVYDGFTVAQKAAMAKYVEALPRLVQLDREDATHVSRSMGRYWAQFLPNA
jgi:hypothetical protein